MSDPLRISQIIATTCESRRAAVLRRAIESVEAQREVAVELLLIANGPRVDESLLAELTTRDGIRIHRVAEAGYSNALRVGREITTCEFFGFLDDDDELLPGALAARVATLRADSGAAAVVSAGLVERGGRHIPYPYRGLPLGRDPLVELFRENWLPSGCAGLFRLAAVTTQHIAQIRPYREWTSLAFALLASGFRFAFLAEPGYRTYDTPESMMKEPEYLEVELPMLEGMLVAAPSRSVARAIRRQLVAAHHVRAEHRLHSGEVSAAWRSHLRSLRWPGTLRYLPFTRRLILHAAGLRRTAPPPAAPHK